MDGDYVSIDIKGIEKIKGSYYFKTLAEKNQFLNNYQLGDFIIVTGTFERPKKNTVPNLFNYRAYLERKNIFYILSIDTIQKQRENSSFFYYIKNWIIQKLEGKKEKCYYYAFFLGDTSYIEDSILKTYQENGISHLFAISGMHISFFSGILLFLLKKLGMKENKRYLITIFFLLFYMFLSGSSPSVSRAVIFFIFLHINKIGKLELSTLKIFFFTFCFFGILNPNLLLEVGFQYSFLVSFTLLLLQDKEKNRAYFSSLLKISIISFLVGLPITLFYFYQINFLSVFYNLFFVPLVSCLIFPFSFLSFFFSFLEPIFSIFILILEKSSWFCSHIFSFSKAIFGKPNVWFFFLYYFCFFLFFYAKKKIGIVFLLGLLGIQYFSNVLFPSNYCLMIDVGQGDSILIHSQNQNILIDTGGKVNYTKEEWQQRTISTITDYTLIPLFKSLGIKKLDYLILTHGDYDHMGESINLVNHFFVEKVIFNQGEDNDLEKCLIKVLEKKNIPHYKRVKSLDLGQAQFQFLNTRIYDNENDNSNVMYVNFYNYQFLFMGDAGRKKEYDILEKYQLGKIDFLKVGHHGSNTSTSKELISAVKPTYSFISVGKNNRYGHPTKEVLDILSNSKIYRTDQNGSIQINLKDRNYEIITYQ